MSVRYARRRVRDPRALLAGEDAGDRIAAAAHAAGRGGRDRVALRRGEALPAAVAQVGCETADQTHLGGGEPMRRVGLTVLAPAGGGPK